MPSYIPADSDGGTCTGIIDLSNTRGTRRTLSNIDVFERVGQFLTTGDPQHLPPELRGEAEGIRALCASALAAPEPSWPSSAARPNPGPGASLGEAVRALAGDERADADSGLYGDDGPDAA